MALSKRSFANLEAIEDDDVRDAFRLLYDRIHDLESRGSSGVQENIDAGNTRITHVGAAIDPGDAVSLDFADNRYEPFRLSKITLENAAIAKLVGLGLTEEEARSLL